MIRRWKMSGQMTVPKYDEVVVPRESRLSGDQGEEGILLSLIESG